MVVRAAIEVMAIAIVYVMVWNMERRMAYLGRC